ncbi:hypothetical protein [Rhodoferax sp.]|uniref:hypothetical protein n=1 Tax=Rhodoferax sp. TaxID=50421 RepID=UPI001EC940E3|nr:hypothetical protein [Rhodoferax sp.]MBT9507309.1 hypothetical protein [Rhodoferax sp.]
MIPQYLLSLSLCALLATPVGAQPVSFGLFGDTPYSPRERERLPELMAEMDREDLAFVVHDGDIKSGGSVCSDEVLRDMLGVFQASRHPLVFVPGDNEWTDCHRSNNGSYDPLERLGKLRELFFAGDTALGQRPMPLVRQSSDPAFAGYRENVRWELGGALFVGLNLPGSENNYHGTTRGGGPVPEFIERGAANRAWLAQAFALARTKKLAGIMIVIQANPELEAFSAGHTRPGYREFLTQLRAETQAFAGQVVLVHGDTHWQKIDQPMLDSAGNELVKNFTRVETFGSPFMGWIKASVDVTDPQVFRFSPRRLGSTPPQN